MSRSLQIAVAGYGQVSSMHAQILRDEGYEIRWVIGPSLERAAAFAARWQARHHGTLLQTALEDPAVDAVILGTPNEVHADQAVQCIRAGKHVLVEIPLAMSLRQAMDVRDLAREHEVVVMVSHTHRFLPGLRALIDDVREQRRRFDSVLSRYLLLRRDRVGSSGYVRSWTDDLLWHHMNHSVDITLQLLGVARVGAVQVTARSGPPDPSTGKSFDLSLVLSTEAGQIATLVGSYNHEPPQIYDYYLSGYVSESPREAHRATWTRCSALYDPLHETRPGVDRISQNREFFEAVIAGRPAAISPDSIMPAMQVLQTAQDQIQEAGA